MDPSKNVKVCDFSESEKLKIIKEIGRGTSSKVFSVEDEKGKRFVLKRFHDADSIVKFSSDYEVKTTKEEFESAFSIESFILEEFVNMNVTPNLYKIYKDEKNGKGALLMEECENMKTSLFLKSKASLLDIYLISLDILKNLNYLHSFGVYLCDLKPENIVYGRDKHLFIDFGSAFIRERTPFHKTNPCTIFWTSPEFLFKSKDKMEEEDSMNLDMWSFGIILCNLLHIQPFDIHKDEMNETNFHEFVAMKMISRLGEPSEEEIKSFDNYHKIKTELLKRRIEPSPLFPKIRERIDSLLKCGPQVTIENLVIKEKIENLLKKILLFDGSKRIKSKEALVLFDGL